MCRSIKTLFNFEPPVTDAEIRAASLQFVRKVSGFTAPSKKSTQPATACSFRCRPMRRQKAGKKKPPRPACAAGDLRRYPRPPSSSALVGGLRRRGRDVGHLARDHHAAVFFAALDGFITAVPAG